LSSAQHDERAGFGRVVRPARTAADHVGRREAGATSPCEDAAQRLGGHRPDASDSRGRSPPGRKSMQHGSTTPVPSDNHARPVPNGVAPVTLSARPFPVRTGVGSGRGRACHRSKPGTSSPGRVVIAEDVEVCTLC
jgi:hypothetical protein